MFWDLTPIGLITTAALSFAFSELTDAYSAVLSQYQPFQQLFTITCFLRDVVRDTHSSWSFHYPKASLALALTSTRLIGLVSALSDISSASNYVLDVFGCLAPLPASAVPQVIGGVIEYVGSAFAFLRNLLSWTSPLPSFTVSSNYAMPSYFLVSVTGMDESWLPELPQAEGWNLLRTFSSGVSVTSKPSDVDVEVARAFLARFDPPKEDYSGFLALIALMFLSVVLAFVLLSYKLVNASAKTHSATGLAHDASNATALLEQGHCKRNISYDPSSSTETSHGTEISLDTLIHCSGTPGWVLRSLKNAWYGMAASAPVVGPSTPRVMFVNEGDDGHTNVVPGGYPVLLPAIELENKTLRTTPSPSYGLKETRNPSRGLAALKSATGRLSSPLYKSEETRHPSLGLAASESATLRKRDDVFGDDVFHGQSPTIALESPTSAAVTRMIKMLDAMASSSLTSSLGDAADIEEEPSPRWIPPSTPQRQSSPRIPTPALGSTGDFVLADSIRKQHVYAIPDVGASLPLSPSSSLRSLSVLPSSPSPISPSSVMGLTSFETWRRDYFESRDVIFSGVPDVVGAGTLDGSSMLSPRTPASAGPRWTSTPRRQSSPSRISRSTGDFVLTDSIRKQHVCAFPDADTSSPLSSSSSLWSTSVLLPSSPPPLPAFAVKDITFETWKRDFIERRYAFLSRLPSVARAGTLGRSSPLEPHTPASEPPATWVLPRRFKSLDMNTLSSSDSNFVSRSTRNGKRHRI